MGNKTQNTNHMYIYFTVSLNSVTAYKKKQGGEGDDKHQAKDVRKSLLEKRKFNLNTSFLLARLIPRSPYNSNNVDIYKTIALLSTNIYSSFMKGEI